MNVEPTPGSLRDRERAAEQLRQPPRQRQAKAGSAHAALQPMLELRELLEDPRLIVGRDADAGVATVNDNLSPPGRRVAADREPRRAR